MTQQQLLALIEQYYEQLRAVQQTVHSLQQQLHDVPKKIQYYDLVQSDLLHELEIMQLNAVQGTKVLKELKNVRKERRLYKNMQLFSQQEQKNLQAIAALNVTTSPFEAAKTYTYRTKEGYALHESLKGNRSYDSKQIIKPPKMKVELPQQGEIEEPFQQEVPMLQQHEVEESYMSDLEQEAHYRIMRANKQWLLFCNQQQVAAYTKITSMKTYLQQHNIVVQYVSHNRELFQEFLAVEQTTQ